MDLFKKDRNSKMVCGEVYFWTSTVHQWTHLLKSEAYKKVIIDSLSNLVQRNKIKVYGFVIMPNHLHLLWEMLEMNGKEMPHASFQKYTAHIFQDGLRMDDPEMLKQFYVNEKERMYRFWQRDALAGMMTSREMAEQKLDYLHNNPLQSHWNLSKRPEDYYYSSASFYEIEESDFNFLTDYRDRL